MTTQHFTPEQYTAFKADITPYIQNVAKSLDIPRVQTPIPWQKIYRSYGTPKPLDPKRSLELSREGQNNKVAVSYTDFPLGISNDGAFIGKDQIAMMNNPLLARQVISCLENIVQDSEKIIFAGDSTLGINGIVGGGTMSGLTDATVATYGDVAEGIAGQIAAIPSRLKDMGKGVVTWMTHGLYQQLFTNVDATNGLSEMDLVRKTFMGPDVEPGMRVHKIISTNAPLGYTTPSLSNQIMVTAVLDPRVLEVATSFPLGIIGEVEEALGINVQCGWMGAACVHEPLGVHVATGITTTNAGA